PRASASRRSRSSAAPSMLVLEKSSSMSPMLTENRANLSPSSKRSAMRRSRAACPAASSSVQIVSLISATLSGTDCTVKGCPPQQLKLTCLAGTADCNPAGHRTGKVPQGRGGELQCDPPPGDYDGEEPGSGLIARDVLRARSCGRTP